MQIQIPILMVLALVLFDTTSNEVTFECWPRNVDVTNEAAKQFLGWPLKVKN